MLMCSDNQVRLCGFFRGGFMKKLAAMIFFAMVSGNAMAQAGGASSGTGAGSAGSGAAGGTAGAEDTGGGGGGGGGRRRGQTPPPPPPHEHALPRVVSH